jgi:phage-related protein (TIGR01555 family)
MGAESQSKADGWSNVVTGLGSAADKRKYAKSEIGKIVSDDELESVFIDDGLGARIVTELPNDMFREGWDYSFPDLNDIEIKKVIDEYKSVMENIGAVQKIKEAFYWARLYGGAIIVIGFLDGQDMDKPLNTKRIRSFDNLRVIDRKRIDFAKIQFQLDPTMPRYGQPECYPVDYETESGAMQTKLVHHTRVIEIHGVKVPPGATRILSREQRYWGLSILQKVFDRLKAIGESEGNVAALIDEFSIGKFKLSNLADIISQPDGKELMQRRVELMDLVRSVFHSMYLDKDDDFVRENVSFTGIPEVMYIFMMLVSSCSGYPITRLFGVSPAGLNSTGESDMLNYYDQVRAEQVASLEPILLRLVRIISENKGLAEPYFDWKPLKQKTDKEKSELEKLDAEKEKVIADTWKTYIDAGILEPYQAAFLQFGDDLEKIPIPEDLELPPVPPVVEPIPNAKGKEGNAEDEESNEESDLDNENTEEYNTEEEITARIAELEGLNDLEKEETAELEELKIKLETLKAEAAKEG